MAEKETETRQTDIIYVLQDRFVDVPQAITTLVRTIADREQLREYLRHSSQCQSLDCFREFLVPLYQQQIAEAERETTQKNILQFLRASLGEVPERVADQVRTITDRSKLMKAVEHAVVSKSIADFRKRIAR